MKSLLILTRDPDAPSFRYRIRPLIKALSEKGVNCQIQLFRSKCYGFRLVAIQAAIKSVDAVYVHKLKLLPFESNLLTRFNSNTFFDVDDAFYVRQPKRIASEAKETRARRRKFNGIARVAKISSVGNSILAAKVREADGNPIIIPTGIDVDSYLPLPLDQRKPHSIVWVGLPGNLRYLELIRPAFAEIQRLYPNFTLRVISSGFPDWREINIEKITWSSESEKREIPRSCIGVMPLFDDAYSRGKCAFKLLQYMAAGIPCIASPVGANCDVIQQGENGFLARTTAEWVDAIIAIFSSPELQDSMGLAGRKTVDEEYRVDTLAEKLATAVVAELN